VSGNRSDVKRTCWGITEECQLIVTEEDFRKLGWEKDYREFEQKFDELKGKIAKTSGAKKDLWTLKEDGADPDLILEQLTHIIWDLPMACRKDMERHQDKLARTAKALHYAAEAVERVSRDPSCYPGSWMAVLNRHAAWSEVKRQMFVPSRMLRGMRAYEKYALDIAKMFGEIRRKQAQLIRMEKIGSLVAYIRHATGRNHDDELARLITDAHEAAGSKRQFSADQLKKLRQRHIPKRVPSFLEMLGEEFAAGGKALRETLEETVANKPRQQHIPTLRRPN
jgi:hypothetical protein